MSTTRLAVIPHHQVQRTKLDEIRDSGFVGICIPLPATRRPIQSAVDDALKLGLSVYGLIEPEFGSEILSLHRIRRLVEAYPNLDGYFLAAIDSGTLDAARDELSGYNIKAVSDPDSQFQLIPLPPLDTE